MPGRHVGRPDDEGTSEVYRRCMARTNIDIDDEACERVMRMYGLETKRDAINLALRKLAVEPLTKAELLAMNGLWADRPVSELDDIVGYASDDRPARR